MDAHCRHEDSGAACTGAAPHKTCSCTAYYGGSLCHRRLSPGQGKPWTRACPAPSPFTNACTTIVASQPRGVPPDLPSWAVGSHQGFLRARRSVPPPSPVFSLSPPPFPHPRFQAWSSRQRARWRGCRVHSIQIIQARSRSPWSISSTNHTRCATAPTCLQSSSRSMVPLSHSAAAHRAS